jgi:hypothetical protein
MYSANGTWILDFVILEDRVGNWRSLDDDDLEKAGLATTLEVISPDADAIAPTLTALSFTPEEIDVRSGDATVTITASATDVGVGVAYISPGFRSPSGKSAHGCNIYVSPPSTSGTWSCTMTIPRNSEGGAWTLDHVFLVDEVRNTREMRPEELKEAGFTAKLEVKSN